ncbi:MAG: hypothetical protein Q8P05_03190 [Candidatus Diapherotrites archaeon]|nr:hypothetical protein [Candidatus Diapherotrites archaeon]
MDLHDEIFWFLALLAVGFGLFGLHLLMWVVIVILATFLVTTHFYHGHYPIDQFNHTQQISLAVLMGVLATFVAQGFWATFPGAQIVFMILGAIGAVVLLRIIFWKKK